MASIGIIGAGFSGLGMAIKLKQAGFENIRIYEAADDIGGTVSSHQLLHAPACAPQRLHRLWACFQGPIAS